MSEYSINPADFTFQKHETWPYISFYEKIRYYKDVLDEKYSPYIDKLVAKKIVKDLCGDSIQVPKVIRVLSGPDDITLEDLNPNWLIKATHGSGWNINITKSTTVDECIKKLHDWNRPYGIESKEKHYIHITPRFFIEEKIDDKYTGKSGDADVFMFRCVKGLPITIGIRRGAIQNSYDINFNPIDQQKIKIEIPQEIHKMIDLCKILSKPFEFVRLDFYLGADSEIYFSEFTFTPAGGNRVYFYETEKRLGALWP